MADPIARRLLAGAVRASGLGRRYRSAAQVRRHTRRLAVRPARYAPPRGFGAPGSGVSVSVRWVGGRPVYRLTPQAEGAGDSDGRPVPLPHVVYLHGGAYVYEIVGPHWWFVRRLAVHGPAVVDVPIYPLAPAATAAETVAGAEALVREVIEESRDVGGRVVVAGDSAGGGLALAATLMLRDAGEPMPDRLLLVSPWLDLTMTDPAQPAIAPADPLLGIDGLAEAARLYAGTLGLRDPRVSPLFADLAGLPPMTVFGGSHDILHPDALRLADRARAAGVDVDLHDVEGGLHVFPLLPVGDGRRAWPVVRAALGS